MRIIVLGGDGLCGWPTALYLFQLGHDVLIVDCFVRRNIDNELEVHVPDADPAVGVRLAAWEELSGNGIEHRRFDAATDYELLRQTLQRPTSLVPSCTSPSSGWPRTMKSSAHKRYTVTNNINATHNLLAAIVGLPRTSCVSVLERGMSGAPTSNQGIVPATQTPETRRASAW